MNIRDLWWKWLRGWIELSAGLITILTLGLYHPQWSTTYIMWRLQRSFGYGTEGLGLSGAQAIEIHNCTAHNIVASGTGTAKEEPNAD